MVKEAMDKLPFSESKKNHAENLLCHTPDHPAYAVMIERAIRELNEEEGSSEESISNFIRKEYKDLPFAHLTLLHHHLKQLCENGCIILTQSQHYLLADTDSTFPFGKNIKRMNSRTKQDLLKLFKEHKNCLEPQLRKDKPSKENAEQIDDDDDDPTEVQYPDIPPGFETIISKEKSNFLVSCTNKLLEMKSEVARNKPSSSNEQHSPLADSSSPATSSSLLQQFQAHKFSKHGDSDFEELLMKQPWMTPYCHEQQLLNFKVSQPEQHQTPVNPSRFATKPTVCDNKTGAQKIVPLPSSSDQQEFNKQQPWMTPPWHQQQLLNLKMSQPEQQHQTPVNSNRFSTTKQAVLDKKYVPLPPSSDQQEFYKQQPWMPPHWHDEQMLNLKVSQPAQHQTPVNSSRLAMKQAVLDKSSTRVILPASLVQQEFKQPWMPPHWHEEQMLHLKMSQPEQHQTPVNSSRLAMKQAVLDKSSTRVTLPPSSVQQEFKQPWMPPHWHEGQMLNLKMSQPEQHQTPVNSSRLAMKQAVLDKSSTRVTLPHSSDQQEFRKQPWMAPHWHQQHLLNLKVSQPEQQHQTPVNSSRFSTSKQAVLDKSSTRVTLPPASYQQQLYKFPTLQMHPTHPPWKKVPEKLSYRVVQPPWVQQQQWKLKEKPGSEMMIIKEDSIPNPSDPGVQFNEGHGSTGEERKSGSAAGEGTQQNTQMHGRFQKKG